MNGVGAGGFAQGFASGFGLMDAHRRLQLADASAQEDRALRQRQLELSEQQQQRADQREQRQAENDAERLTLAREAFGLQKTNTEADNLRSERTLGLAEARDKRDAAEAAVKQQMDELKLGQAQQQAEAQKRMAGYQQKVVPFVTALAADGNAPVTAQNLQDLKDFTGLDALQWSDPAHIQKAVETYGRIRSGELSPNSTEAIELANLIYGPYVQRNLAGLHTAPDGREFTVTAKDISAFVPVKDRPGFFIPTLKVRGKTADGQELSYDAPLTQYGTSHPDDPALAVSPDLLEQPLVQGMLLHQKLAANPNARAALDQWMLERTAGGQQPLSAKDQADLEHTRQQTKLVQAQTRKVESESGVDVGAEKEIKRLNDVSKRIGELLETNFGPKSSALGGILDNGDPDFVRQGRSVAAAYAKEHKDATDQEIWDNAIDPLIKARKLKASDGQGGQAAANPPDKLKEFYLWQRK